MDVNNRAESAVLALVSQKGKNALQPLPKIRTQGKTFTLTQEFLHSFFLNNSLVSSNHFVLLIFAFLTVEMRGWPGASPFIGKPELA